MPAAKRHTSLPGLTPGLRLLPTRGRHGFLFAIRLLLLLRLAAFADVDAALEERTIFNRDACRNDVARQGTIAADVDAIARRQIPAHFSQHHDFTRINVRRHDSVAANRDSISRQIDGTLDPAVDKSDSDPVTSPLITSDLPIVAWSAVVVVTGRGGAAGSVDAITGALGVDWVGLSGSAGRPGV